MKGNLQDDLDLVWLEDVFKNASSELIGTFLNQYSKQIDLQKVVTTCLKHSPNMRKPHSNSNSHFRQKYFNKRKKGLNSFFCFFLFLCYIFTEPFRNHDLFKKLENHLNISPCNIQLPKSVWNHVFRDFLSGNGLETFQYNDSQYC